MQIRADWELFLKAARGKRLEKNKLRKQRRLENLKVEKAKNKKEQPETIGVMFIDQTVDGLLAKLLQEVEDRLARTTGYRIRMVELSGSKLCHLLPSTNPWSGQDCGREKCVTCGQGGERLVECKRRNILYESECTVCNPVDARKEKEADLGKRQGVYVGESSRSIHERAFEHDGDYKGQKDDSHMMKHWLTSHADLDAPPAFRFRLVRSFPDALTRQISEAVRIDLRGEGVLNSRAEFSRCRLPRLVIDQEGWKRSKAEEKITLEKKEQTGGQQGAVQGFGQEEEGWEEWVSNLLEDELDMDSLQKKSKGMELKRKAESNTRPAKRKKLDTLENWGTEGSLEDDGIRKWLIGDENRKEEVTGRMMNQSIQVHRKTIRMKQLEVSFGGILVNRELDNVPEGWNAEVPDAQKKRRMTKKQLAKTNQKMTMFLKAPISLLETTMMNDATLERKRIVAIKDRDWGNRRMVTSLLRDILGEVPGLVEAKGIVESVLDVAWTRVGSREMAGKEATMVMEYVLEKAWWKYMVEDIWKMLVDNKELQRIMTWRMTNQRQDENMLGRFLDRQERLQRREEAQRKWRKNRSLMEEPMDIDTVGVGVMKHWAETEIH